MVLVVWKEEYSVNIQEIDRQHKRLFDMINGLHEAMLSGKGHSVLNNTISGLVDYTVTHFRTEESLLKQHNYPGYLNHKAEHDRFVQKIKEFEEKFQKGELGITIEILNFLKDWLSSHILVVDKRYSKYLNDRGVR